MSKKQYSIYCGGQKYIMGLGGSNFVPISDSDIPEKAKWFEVTVTNWDDNGMITGTYKLNNNMPQRIRDAMHTGILFIAVLRKEASKHSRKTRHDYKTARKKQWHVDVNSCFVISNTTGSFEITIPEILSSCQRASYEYKEDIYHQPYQEVKLAIVKLTASGHMFNKYIAIPNTEHTFYY